MGKIIIYIIYFLVAIAIYVLIRSVYLGDINQNTTLKETAIDIKNGSIETIKEIENDASSAINTIKNDIKKGNSN